MPNQTIRNLVAAIVTGALVLWWLHSHTESVEAVIAFVSLGGIVPAWVSFVATTFLSKKRQNSLQTNIKKTFDGPWPERISIGLFLLLLLVSAFCGAVRIENAQSGDALVYIFEDRLPKQEEAERITAGGKLNSLQWMCPFSTREISVRIAGLSERKVKIRPWWRSFGPTSLQAPGSFLNAAVLISAEMTFVVNADPKRYTLKVTINDCDYTAPYDGRAVWVGAVEDNPPPLPNLRDLDEWKTMLNKSKSAVRLLPAKSHKSWPMLKHGDRVSASLIDNDKSQPEQIVAVSWPIQIAQPPDRSAVVTPMVLLSR